MRAMMIGWLSSAILTASSMVRTFPLVSSGVGKGRMPLGGERYSRGSCCMDGAEAPGMAPVPGGGASGPVGAVIVNGGAGSVVAGGEGCPGDVAGGEGGVGKGGLPGKGGVPGSGGVPPGRGDVPG